MSSSRSGGGQEARPRQQIGEAVRDFRRRRGWTLAELSQRSGISRSHLSRLEQGKSVPSYKLLSRLAAAFGVEITYFTEVERTGEELSAELHDYLVSLGIPAATWAEFGHLSLEARAALIDALRRLTAPKRRAMPRERALEISLLGRGVAESLPLIVAGIEEFGLAPVDYYRSQAQIEEMPGDRLEISDRLSLTPAAESFDQLQIFRVLHGVEIPNPMLLKWWTRLVKSALSETLSDHEARTIYRKSDIERYLRTGQWQLRLPLAPETVHEHVRATIELVRSNPRYRIGLIDDLPPIGFVAKGTSGVVVRARMEGDPLSADPSRLGLHFSGPALAAQFRSYFDELWESIPEADKDSEQVAHWLESSLVIGRSL